MSMYLTLQMPMPLVNQVLGLLLVTFLGWDPTVNAKLFQIHITVLLLLLEQSANRYPEAVLY